MKKIFSVMAIALLATGLFAKTWTNNVGVGFTVPISTIGIDKSGADDIFQVGYGVKGFYLGYHQNGFTVRAAESLGLATSKDIKLQDRDTNLGFFSNLDLGAGYSFIRDDKMTLSLLGMIGLDIAAYSTSRSSTYDKKSADLTATLGYAMFSVGADAYFAFKFKPNFGLFADVACRYLVAGGSFGETEYEYKNGSKTETVKFDTTDGDLRGKFRIQPSIGVVWSF